MQYLVLDPLMSVRELNSHVKYVELETYCIDLNVDFCHKLKREQSRDESKSNATCPVPVCNVTALRYCVGWRATNVEPVELEMDISFNLNAMYLFYWVLYGIERM